MGPGGPSCPGEPGSPCSPCEKSFSCSQHYSLLHFFPAYHWFSVLAVMIDSPNLGPKCTEINKRNYCIQPNGSIIPWSLLSCFAFTKRVSTEYIVIVAQTYNRTRDSTQTLRTRLSCRSLGPNWSCFTYRTLSSWLTLCVDTQELWKNDTTWNI